MPYQISPGNRVWRIKSSIQRDGKDRREKARKRHSGKGQRSNASQNRLHTVQSMREISSPIPKMGYQSKSRNQEKRGEGNPIKDTKHGDYPEDGRGQKRRAMLPRVSDVGWRRKRGSLYRIRDNALDQDQTPGDNESLDRVGKGVRLVRPRNVRRGDQQGNDAPGLARLDELVDSPVLEDKVHDEHQDPQRPEYGDRRYLSVLAVAHPEPAEQEHRKPVDRP